MFAVRNIIKRVYLRRIHMDFVSAKEAADKWDISKRRVQVLCSEGRINGAKKVGMMWIIPGNATKHKDNRRVVED